MSQTAYACAQTLRVHILCAQWCGVCRDYQIFADAQRQQGQDQWVWVDIETHADLLGDLDIENFPTLLICQAEQVLFLGAISPQAGVALRLIQSLHEGNRYEVPPIQNLQSIVHALKSV